MNKEIIPTINIDIDDDLKGFLKIKCPECTKTKKINFSKVSPGYIHTCDCGYSFKFTGDTLKPLQDSFDKLNSSFKKLK